MHPVLTSVPGAVFKLLAPALVAWGSALLSRALIARLRARRTGDDAPRVEIPSHAFLLLAVGVGLFAYSAPWHGGGVLSPRVWSARWLALPLYAYGVMLGLSLIVGWYLTLAWCERLGLSRAKMADCFVVAAVSAVVGARLLYVVTNPGEFVDPATHHVVLAAMLALRSGGLVAYGAFLAGLAGSWWWLRRNGYGFWNWADAAVPSLALGVALTRVGCYLYGCDFGRPLSARAPHWLRSLGTFPRWSDATGAPAWEQQRRLGFASDATACIERFHGDWLGRRCHLDAGASASVPVHPTQLYESLVGLAIFAVLVLLWRRGRRFPGELFLAFGVLYGFARAALEVLRGDAERGSLAGLSTSQWIGLVTGVVCLVIYVRTKSTLRSHPSMSDGFQRHS